MSTRRTFLCTLPLVTAGVASAPAAEPLPVDGVDSAKTVPELKRAFLIPPAWKEAEFEGRKFLFALTNMGDGESYIDLHGWIYSRFFKEWRRILKVKTRGVGKAVLTIDEKKGWLSVRGDAYNELKGAEVFRFDLRATSDDAGYVR